MLEQAFRLFHSNIAVDFGSSTIRIFIRGQGLVVQEPSIVVTKKKKKHIEIVAFGEKAKMLLGKTPESMDVHIPIQGSVIQDYDLALTLCRQALEKALGKTPLIKPKLLWIMPHGISQQQRNDYLKILYTIGNRESIYVDSLLCSGLGAKLPVNEPFGSLILDIGHGSSQLGLLSLSGISAHGQTRWAGQWIDRSIQKWLKENRDLEIGIVLASKIKESIGEAEEPDPQRNIHFTCRQASSGQAIDVQLSSEDIFAALQTPLRQIVMMLKKSLVTISPELAGDILERGLMLCGGSAQLHGIDDFFSAHLNIPTFITEQPSLCNIEGGGALLEDSHLLDWLGETT